MYRSDYRQDYDRSYDQSHSSYSNTRSARDPYFDDQQPPPPPPQSRERERAYGFDSQDRSRGTYDDQSRSPYDAQDHRRSGGYDSQDHHRGGAYSSSHDHHRAGGYDAQDGRRSSYPLTPPHDDPYYRRSDVPPLLQTVHSPLDVEPGFAPYGSVMVCLPPPFESRAKKRDKPANCDTVFVGSLPDNMQEKHLQDLFMDCGRIAAVRLSRGRNFGHVQFANGESVDKAVEFSGARVKIGSSSGDIGKIYVDYAHPKGESEGQKKLQDGELVSFNTQNATLVSSDLHNEDSFVNAVKNVVYWLEKGNCNQNTSSTFFGLITTIHSHARQLAKNMKIKQQEFEEELRKKKKVYVESLAKEYDTVKELFSAATQQKSWDHFTKPQRKYISQWKDHASDVIKEIASAIEGCEAKKDSGDSGEPATKKLRSDSAIESELAVARKEIEYLKSQSEEALEKKDKQILQLKTLMAQFKQTCPGEWEKALGLNTSTKEDTGDGKDSKKVQSQEEPDSDAKMEVIDSLSLDDLTTAKLKEGDSSLTAAAAAYAKMRTAVGTSEPTSGLDLTSAEVAIVAVMATFLTVHPLGATISEITQYFQAFNPVCNSYYLESLLRRLPQVFQLSQSSEGEAKWWFLGFQTCCSQAQHSQLHYTSLDTVVGSAGTTATTTTTLPA